MADPRELSDARIQQAREQAGSAKAALDGAEKELALANQVGNGQRWLIAFGALMACVRGYAQAMEAWAEVLGE